MKKLILITHMLVAGFIAIKMYFALMDSIDLPSMLPFCKYLFAGMIAIMGFTVNVIAYIDQIKKKSSN